jgi:hypothetical protein
MAMSAGEGLYRELGERVWRLGNLMLGCGAAGKPLTLPFASVRVGQTISRSTATPHAPAGVLLISSLFGTLR